MKLLNNYIAIKKTEGEEEQTASGIYVAKVNHEAEEYHIGEVTEAGESKKVKKGDKVLYKHYRNIFYKENEIILEEDLIAKINE